MTPYRRPLSHCPVLPSDLQTSRLLVSTARLKASPSTSDYQECAVRLTEKNDPSRGAEVEDHMVMGCNNILYGDQIVIKAELGYMSTRQNPLHANARYLSGHERQCHSAENLFHLRTHQRRWSSWKTGRVLPQARRAAQHRDLQAVRDVLCVRGAAAVLRGGHGARGRADRAQEV